MPHVFTSSQIEELKEIIVGSGTMDAIDFIDEITGVKADKKQRVSENMARYLKMLREEEINSLSCAFTYLKMNLADFSKEELLAIANGFDLAIHSALIAKFNDKYDPKAEREYKESYCRAANYIEQLAAEKEESDVRA